MPTAFSDAWFAVRVMLAHGTPATVGSRLEERITLWSAADGETAGRLALAEAHAYADGGGWVVLDGLTVSPLAAPTHGSVIFTARHTEELGQGGLPVGQVSISVRAAMHGPGVARGEAGPVETQVCGTHAVPFNWWTGGGGRSAVPDWRGGRRRDDALTTRIFTAARDLVAAEGLPALKSDRLARRSGAGKSAISRRWPNLLDLAAALITETPLIARPLNLGSLRADLQAFTASWAAPLSQQEQAAGSMLGAASHQGVLLSAFDSALHRPAEAAVALIGQRAQERGHSTGPWPQACAVRVVTSQLLSRLVMGPLSVHSAEQLAGVLLPMFPRSPGSADDGLPSITVG